MLRNVGEKMSKSVGNFEPIREALDRWGRETLLVFFLTAHWSKPIDYSDETVRAAEARADSLREVFRNSPLPAAAGEWERFVAALDDDFNTPEALAIMHSWRDHDLLRRALDVFGLASLAEEEAAPPEVVELATRREEARASRDFAEADRLRGEIAGLGWTVRDVAAGFQRVPTTRAA